MKRQLVSSLQSRVLSGLCVSAAMLLPATALTAQDQAAQQEQQQQLEQSRKQLKSKGKSSKEQQPSKKQAKAKAESSRKQAHSGKFVSAVEGKLTMTADGKAGHSHKLTDNTKVTINGKPAHLEDLQKGDKIRVTTGKGNAVVAIEARRGQEQRQPRKQRLRTERQPRSAQSPQGQQGVRLGVQPGPSPTTGVLVRAVRPGSPAQQAGLQRGDYILSIDGTKIASTEELDQALAQKQPGSQADLMIWRNRQKQQMSVAFGGRAVGQGVRRGRQVRRPQARVPSRLRQGEPQTRRVFRPDTTPWLGVFLREADGRRGVLVERIYPSGPAARAGLRPGDVILSINGDDVDSPEEAAEELAEFEPDDEPEFVVLRGSREQRMRARLAARGEFFGPRVQQGEFRGDSERSGEFADDAQQRPRRMPTHAMMLEQHRRFAEQHQRIEQSIRALQEEVRKLRQEVKRLRGDPQADAPQTEKTDRVPGKERPENADR